MRFLVYILFFTLAGCVTGSYQGPPSDHFDGKYFFNPSCPKRKSTIEILKELASQFVLTECPCLVFCKPSANLNLSSRKNLKITFINHSTVLIQTHQINILIDPIWSAYASPFPIGPKRLIPPGLAFENLPHIDVVLISHNHYDHLDLPTLYALQKCHRSLFIVPLGNKNFLEKKGICNVVELDWWQQYQLKNTVITLLPAQHWSARWLNDSYRTLWGAYGIKTKNKKIYFAGDTGYGNHFSALRKWGKPDIALIPIGAYEPRELVYPDHLNPCEAIRAHEDLNSKLSIGVHFGTFTLGCAAINKPLYDLEKCKKPKQPFIVLGQGCSLER